MAVPANNDEDEDEDGESGKGPNDDNGKKEVNDDTHTPETKQPTQVNDTHTSETKQSTQAKRDNVSGMGSTEAKEASTAI